MGKKKSAGRVYLLALGIYLLFSAGVIGLGICNKDPYDYKMIPNHTSMNYGGRGLEVVSREYNPKNKTFEMDLYVSEYHDKKELYNPLETSSAKYITDNVKVTAEIPKGNGLEQEEDKKEFKTKVRKVSPNYYAVYVLDVPNKYGALKTDVTVENENMGSMDETTDTIYSLQDKVKENNSISKNENIDELEVKALDENIRQCNQAIKKYENKVKDNESSIRNKKDEITALENELDGQTESEKKSTHESISDVRGEISSIESDNKDLTKVIDELKNKISLLERQKQNVDQEELLKMK